MTYKVNRKTLKLLADLSKLTLTKEEQERFLKQLQEIVEYISKIKELQTRGVKPSFHSVNAKNVFREDSLTKNPSKRKFSQKEALSQAKETKGGYFVVPKVIDK